MQKVRNFIFIAILLSLCALFSSRANAQEISLSISPPLLEVMIQPGKQISQAYVLSNLGADTVISPKITFFKPADEFGNISVLEDYALEPQNAPSWFSLTKPSLSFGDKFALRAETNQELVLTISPPYDAPEGDYYLTMIFETNPEGQIGSTDSTAKVKIGTNILLTVSKDGRPYKKARIAEFSAPKIIDSLAKIIYTVKIENISNSFFKPNGKIIVDPLIGSEQTLNLAPLNTLASSTRQIFCIKDENLMECKLENKVYLGTYKAVLEFTLDESGEIYKGETLTFAFPFSIILALTAIFLIYKKIKNQLIIRKQSKGVT